MCYSATASFTSAALLTAIGSATYSINRSRSNLMLSLVPFYFAIQQASEGLIWHSMRQNNPSLQQISILIFLGFALVVWPSWVPWTIYSLEVESKRKKQLKIIGWVGLSVSALAAWILISTEAKAFISGHSLGYSFINLKRHWSANFEFLAYITPTLFPFFISSLKIVKMAGYLIFTSMIFTQFINKEASTSIWCFFAALISMYIAIYIFYSERKRRLAEI